MYKLVVVFKDPYYQNIVYTDVEKTHFQNGFFVIDRRGGYWEFIAQDSILSVKVDDA